jgi:exosortase/archaeosortase family protein
MPQQNSHRWIWPLTVAAAAFLLLETIDGFIAVPLRELSSVLVQLFLGTFGFPITRTGTILSTPTMTFEVVPACSGSTTLRVLLFFCIVWAGSHPRLTTARRFAAAALAVPLAILANVVRVSILVVTGYLAGKPVNDFLHALTGVVAFILAMIGSYLVTERLASTATPRPGGGTASRVLLAALLLFLFAPFLVWCIPGWAFPLDRLGFLFTVPAAAAGAWLAWRAPADGSCERSGTAAFGAALAFLLAATVMDINILKGIAALTCLIALALATRGRGSPGSPWFWPRSLIWLPDRFLPDPERYRAAPGGRERRREPRGEIRARRRARRPPPAARVPPFRGPARSCRGSSARS